MAGPAAEIEELRNLVNVTDEPVCASLTVPNVVFVMQTAAVVQSSCHDERLSQIVFESDVLREDRSVDCRAEEMPRPVDRVRQQWLSVPIQRYRGREQDAPDSVRQ